MLDSGLIFRTRRNSPAVTTRLEWHRALEAMRAGRPVILMDDSDRENEGDIKDNRQPGKGMEPVRAICTPPR
ncbi:3,4-dihydroxy-2-butanone-4-phosphate synthase [Acidithiobacillus ferrivorans]|uniref:3,4-dihydroxy-2-butanone-4-phosphate synthase n=1 Tax=Acidithiobacillus ferrivorans TaxID=160808 RepID=UPI0029C076E4|nr:3,4-dihydroxy-2-butanone-4-phosphate synthase [Acidithiobacillus ferrivorans]